MIVISLLTLSAGASVGGGKTALEPENDLVEVVVVAAAEEATGEDASLSSGDIAGLIICPFAAFALSTYQDFARKSLFSVKIAQ